MGDICCRYFVKNFEWLEEQIGEGEDDYYLFDCPGQEIHFLTD